ncbi:MAG: helix-turn-helix transcriptional regulator [Eubacteriales bacterium]
MIENLRSLKERSHMTNQQIAEKSGVPESTVARIFSGKTPNPTVVTVISMARAMGGSAADLFSDEDGEENSVDADKEIPGSDVPESSDAPEGASPDNSAQGMNNAVSGASYEYCANPSKDKYYDDMIEFYKSTIRKKDEWIKRLFWCLFIIVLLVLLILIFDFLNPNFGYVRY